MPLIEVTLEEAGLLQAVRKTRWRFPGHDVPPVLKLEQRLDRVMLDHARYPRYMKHEIAVNFAQEFEKMLHDGRMPVAEIDDRNEPYVKFRTSLYLIPAS